MNHILDDQLFEWASDTAYISSVQAIMAHPVAVKLEFMGSDLDAHIISIFEDRLTQRDKGTEPNEGLRYPIVGLLSLMARRHTSPVQPHNRGVIFDMMSDWVEWWDLRTNHE